MRYMPAILEKWMENCHLPDSLVHQNPCLPQLIIIFINFAATFWPLFFSKRSIAYIQHLIQDKIERLIKKLKEASENDSCESDYAVGCLHSRYDFPLFIWHFLGMSVRKIRKHLDRCNTGSFLFWRLAQVYTYPILKHEKHPS